MRRLGLMGLTSGMLLVASGAAAQAPANPVTPVKATVEQLGWVTGAWRGMLGERTIEQHWMAPLAGSSVAMYRSIRAGKPTVYELLAMENDGDGVTLRIKHLAPGRGLVSQEAKEESVDHALVTIEDRKAVFVGGTSASPVRITFVSPDKDTLNITVERQREGKPVSTEFKYSRISN
jgi:hypothetical protein